MILNSYAPHNGFKVYEVKTIWTARETDKSTIMVGDVNTPLSVTDKLEKPVRI